MAFIYILFQVQHGGFETFWHFGPALTWSANTAVDPKRGIFVFQLFQDYLHFSRIKIQYSMIFPGLKV